MPAESNLHWCTTPIAVRRLRLSKVVELNLKPERKLQFIIYLKFFNSIYRKFRYKIYFNNNNNNNNNNKDDSDEFIIYINPLKLKLNPRAFLNHEINN